MSGGQTTRLPGGLADADSHHKFGTMLGVFTPSVLTILGVIMYLRFGWVIAQTGLSGALAIVLICNAISLITALSASAVATNMPLGAGGEYYLISRSLGVTIGGAIGIPLALCRILSVTLYCFGLTEALGLFWPAGWGPMPQQAITAGLIIIVTLVSGKSAAASLKLQVPMMALVGLSLIALAIGVLAGPLKTPTLACEAPAGAKLENFWVVLAVFFPAVTGFAAGIGMSGDLKDPQRSIPRGTILAALVGLAVYLIVPVLLSVTDQVSWGELAVKSPPSPIWTKIAILGGWLIFPGMWAAILSSAFGSSLAGPRVMQALARDGLAPRFLARTTRTGQPMVATLVSGAIALSAVALGDLNAVAELVTIFFLTLYMSINLVAAAESLVGDPSYRPTLRVPWVLSLLGVAANLVVMFLISALWGAVAIGLQLVLYLLLRRKALRASWGDVWAGLWGSVARFCIQNLSLRQPHARSWRPQLLVFADRLDDRAALVHMGAWFNQNRGVLTVCDMMDGSPDSEADLAEAQGRQAALNEFLQREGILAFGEVNLNKHFEAGVLAVAQANGMGSLRSNTVAFGWPRRPERLAAELRLVRSLDQLGKASMLVRPNPAQGPENFRRIDVWWRGRQNNGDLMLLLAHLLRANPLWRGAKITVRTITVSEAGRRDVEESLDMLIQSVRIDARRDVIVKPADKSVIDVMQQTSAEADVVFLGLPAPEPGEEDLAAQRLLDMTENLPTTVLVRNAGPLRGKLLR